MKEIYGVRLNRVCEELQKMGLSQMIVSDPLSIWYLTGVWVQPKHLVSDRRMGAAL